MLKWLNLHDGNGLLGIPMRKETDCQVANEVSSASNHRLRGHCRQRRRCSYGAEIFYSNLAWPPTFASMFLTCFHA